MSIRKWIERYYPVLAENATSDIKTAIEHSLLKWSGVLPEVLEEYELEKLGNSLYDLIDGEFPFWADNCALCQMFILKNDECIGCPVYNEELGIGCGDTDTDDPIKRPEYIDPYTYWIEYGDSNPMLVALKQALVDYED